MVDSRRIEPLTSRMPFYLAAISVSASEHHDVPLSFFQKGVRRSMPSALCAPDQLSFSRLAHQMCALPQTATTRSLDDQPRMAHLIMTKGSLICPLTLSFLCQSVL